MRNIIVRCPLTWFGVCQSPCLVMCGQDSRQLYLVMDFHPGGDLMALLDRFDGLLEEPTARFYLAEIALALHDLHNMGYVHRCGVKMATVR